MHRSVSFDCPVCRLRHVGESIHDRQTTCHERNTGTPRTIYFNENYEPTLEKPTMPMTEINSIDPWYLTAAKVVFSVGFGVGFFAALTLVWLIKLAS